MIENLINNKDNMFFLIAGPCVIEEEKKTYEIAKIISDITTKNNIPFIFKASYKKANRSRLDSFTGIGDKKTAPDVIYVINNAFDMNPPELISGIITENAVAKPPLEDSIKKLGHIDIFINCAAKNDFLSSRNIPFNKYNEKYT